MRPALWRASGAITPEVMVNNPLPFRHPRHRELYLSGPRLTVGETE
jgi:hypothetical protein